MGTPVDTTPVVLGKITGVFGVRGWIRLYSYTDPREAILAYPGCLASKDDAWIPVRWQDGKRHGKSVVAKLEGVDDRESASNWIGTEIAIPRHELPDAGAGRYYWSDLEGMTVVDREGRELGTVAYLLETGANDVLVVNKGAGESIAGGKDRQELLIPFVMDRYILDVDLAGGRIRVDWEWA